MLDQRDKKNRLFLTWFWLRWNRTLPLQARFPLVNSRSFSSNHRNMSPRRMEWLGTLVTINKVPNLVTGNKVALLMRI